MKKLVFLLLLSQALPRFTFAQEEKKYVINPGEKPGWAVPFTAAYCNPAFTPGTVYFKNKTTGGGNLNYSFLSQEMYFIDPKGDTLALAEPKEVDSVVMGKDVYYNTAEGFVKLDTIAGGVRLCSNYFFNVVNRQVVGAYGAPTNLGGNTTSVRFTSDFVATKLTAQDIITLSKDKTFYAGTRPTNLKAVSKKTMGNVFGKKQNAFDLYLQVNDINFSKREDIIKLITFMNTQ